MKLLVFAHVPPPHHGQAVMVELMLRGLGGNRPQITQISKIDENGGRGSVRADERPQRGTEDTKNVEGEGEKAEKLPFRGGPLRRKLKSEKVELQEVDRGVSGAMGRDGGTDERAAHPCRKMGSLLAAGAACGDSPSIGNCPHEREALDSRPSTLDPITVFHVNSQVSDDLEDVGKREGLFL